MEKVMEGLFEIDLPNPEKNVSVFIVVILGGLYDSKEFLSCNVP